MISAVESFSRRIGLDKAIAYTILTRVVQAGGGILSIFFISKYLTKEEQGYYFTFGSILAVQIFFELGLSTIITQFVAHEVAHLKWDNETQLSGDIKSLSRLSSLLKFCVKWFAVVSVLLNIVLLVGGFLFFIKYGKAENVNWHIPWIILTISTSFSLMVSPILAYLEGLGIVKEVAKIRLAQQTIQIVILGALLVLDFKLLASPLAALCAIAVLPLWLFFTSKKKLLHFIWLQFGEYKVDYRLEIFPYQWRIALSWASGFFIFQLFNPVLFATEGAVAAGQMGMSLAAFNGITAVSISWINTKVPSMASLIAQRSYQALNTLFFQALKYSFIICLASVIFLLTGVYMLQYMQLPLGFRFLPIHLLALLAMATLANQVVSALATYLRCHKQEPFLFLSIMMGVLTALSTIVLGKNFGLNGIVIGYFTLVVLVSLPWAFTVFIRKRKIWHQ